MEGDTLDLNVFHFSFSDDSLPGWENELAMSDTDLVSCAEALENEEIEDNQVSRIERGWPARYCDKRGMQRL